MDKWRCSKCRQIKPVSEFSWRNKSLGQRRGTCRDCRAEQNRRYYAENKEAQSERVTRNRRKAIDLNRQLVFRFLLENPCVDCGEDNPFVLDFDHVEQKYRSIAELVNGGFGKVTLLREMEKCEVRCANCHRLKTAREKGFYQYVDEKTRKKYLGS